MSDDGERTDDARAVRRFGWWDMFVHEDDDPRADGGWENTERAVLIGSLVDRRLTLEMKCAGLDAQQMADRPIPPSDLSLLGLVRHLANVEHHWIRHVLGGAPDDRHHVDGSGHNREFDVTADPGTVEQAWTTWRAEAAYTDATIAGIDDLGRLGGGRPVPVREILVHLIREYAQHLGHADLLRERIDGRIGQ